VTARVLDASAVLAYLHQEPGWDVVQSCIGTACMGTVNWSEVAQKAVRKGLNVEVVRGLLVAMGLRIEPFSTVQAEITARLWERTHQYGLSLADRACLALAIERQATVLTADRAWADLALGVDIHLLR
jgi:PIN domain nuclease of toxin-antitoxin system